jgi:hypothetical protein
MPWFWVQAWPDCSLRGRCPTFFQTVTVVERDVLPDDATNRRGVPWRAAWAKHHRRRYAHRSDDRIGMVEISVI